MTVPAFLKKTDRVRRVLIVDDEKINLYILRKILQKYGYEVHSVENGRDAIKQVELQAFDTVLMDVIMPELDGLEACRIIHAMKPELPIIILTALIDDDSIKKSFTNGASDYLRKPINESELISRLKNVLKTKQAEERYKTMYLDMVNDLEMASEIQLNLLPQWLISREGFVASSLYDPSNKIGGDLFDVINLSATQQLIYMADISGHGVQAALLMTALKSIINTFIASNSLEETEPYKILTKLNTLFARRLFYKNYVTLVMIRIDLKAGKMEIFNAGHPPMICYDSRTKTALTINHKGSYPVGWMPDQAYLKEDQDLLDFSPYKIFLLYTDGIFECVDRRLEQLGLEGLRAIVEEVGNENQFYLMPQRIKEKLLAKKFDFQTDDFAILQFQNCKNDFKKNREVIDLKAALANTAQECLRCVEVVKHWEKDKNLLLKIEIIVSEYLNNIIVHGLRDKEEGAIFIELLYKVNERKVQLRFFDKGMQWDMQRKKQEKSNEGMGESMKSSGYGLAIIETLCESFHLQRVCDINETTIVVG